MPGAARAQRLVFGEVAELYHRSRPGYPPAAFDAIAEFSAIPRGASVLEVGAGTGHATAELLKRGWRVLALEPSQEMAHVAARELAGHAQLEVVKREFERWRPGSRRFALVCSAQAWHWVDPRVRYAKAARVLLPGGTLALLWNRPKASVAEIAGRLEEEYRRWAPHLSARPPGELDLDRRVEIAASGRFGPAQLIEFTWARDYSGDEYVQLMLTQSDHRMLEDRQRQQLMDGIAETIAAAGGQYRVEYLTLLYVAATPR